MNNKHIKFETLENVSSQTLEAVQKMGFEGMTEIQRLAIPKILEEADVRGTAKTGSGKTLAFLIPVIQIIRAKQMTQAHGTGAIVISPTRELAIQIYTVLKELMEKETMTHTLIMGGTNREAEANRLKKGINIIIATPGRLLDHLQHTEFFNYRRLSMLVIDEADRILDLGFEKDMSKILKLIPKKRQTLLFSATKDNRIEKLAKLALNSNLVDIDVDEDKEEATADGLTQSYVICPTENRFRLLYTFLKRNRKKKMMVFFNSCMSCKFHCELLNYINIPVKAMHGRQNQAKRTATFHEFKESETGILLCTDVAARGWDIPAVDWIVQYDPPEDPKEYIHRVGRTARAGGEGNALLILREEEEGFIRYLRTNRVNVESMDVVWSKVANIQNQIEKLMTENYFLHMSGKKAFSGYIRAYDSYALKDVFDVDKIDVTKLGKCFGFPVAPYVDLSSFKMSKFHKRRDIDYRRINKKTTKRFIHAK